MAMGFKKGVVRASFSLEGTLPPPAPTAGVLPPPIGTGKDSVSAEYWEGTQMASDELVKIWEEKDKQRYREAQQRRKEYAARHPEEMLRKLRLLQAGAQRYRQARKQGDALTPPEYRFIKEYIRTGNKARSAMIAFPGYRPKTAGDRGKRLLADPSIKAELQREMEAAGLTTPQLAQKWKEAIETGWGQGAKHRDALHALEMVTRLQGHEGEGKSPQLRVNIHTQAHNMEYEDLLAEYRRLQGITASLIRERGASSPPETTEGEIVAPPVAGE